MLKFALLIAAVTALMVGRTDVAHAAPVCSLPAHPAPAVGESFAVIGSNTLSATCTGTATGSWFAVVKVQYRTPPSGAWVDAGLVSGGDRTPSGSGTYNADGVTAYFPASTWNPVGATCSYDWRSFVTFKDSAGTKIATAHSDIASATC